MAEVILNWDTSKHETGVHTLVFSVLPDGLTQPLATEFVDVDVVPDGMVFVLVRSADQTLGNIVGHVSKPTVVTAPIYAPTDTPTPTSTTTPTPSPTPTPTATPPPHVDAEIVGIVSDPSGTAVQGQHVGVSVTVLNNGNADVEVPVRLSFPSPTKQPETVALRIPANQSADANFTWKTGNYDVGVHTLTAEIVSETNVTSGDTKGDISIQLLEPSISATIESFTMDPDIPVLGDPVSISVEVSNHGPLPANIPVTLHFPSRDKQPETRKPRAEPGETVFANFTWRTGNYEPGHHLFRVTVPGGDRTFTAFLAPPETDFAVADAHVQHREAPIVQGDWVAVSALIHNAGPQKGRANVFLRDISSNRVMYTESVALDAYESQIVEFIWKTLRYDMGSHHLQVAVDAPNDVQPNNDQLGLGLFTILNDGDLTIGHNDAHPKSELRRRLSQPGLPGFPNLSIGSISWRPAAPVVGEAVEITVEISNNGPRAGSLPVTLHFPSDDKQPETRRPRVAGGSNTTANFTWRTGRYAPGTYSFRIESPEHEPIIRHCIAGPNCGF